MTVILIKCKGIQVIITVHSLSLYLFIFPFSCLVDLLPSTTSNNESFVNDTNRQGTTIQTTETNQSNKIDQTSTVPDHSPETVSWSLSKIVQQYGSQPEILELILLSKIEEDRRRAEEAKLKQKELDYLISNGSICSSSSNIGEDTAYTSKPTKKKAYIAYKTHIVHTRQ